MLRKLWKHSARWFTMHFGGRLQLSSVESYSANGNVWYGSNEEYFVISYDGVTRAWDKGMLTHFSGSLSASYRDILAFLLANEGKPVLSLLYIMKPIDFEELQRKHGAFIQDGFIRSTDIQRIKQSKPTNKETSV